MRAFTVVLVAVATGASLQPASAQAPPRPGTCSYENKFCTDFCSSNPQREPGCSSDCSARQADCLKTGTYYWRERPSVRGLIKR